MCINVSTKTQSKRLFEDGYKRCVVFKKTTISRVNCEKRTRFCRQKLHWTVDNHLPSIFFSYETKNELGHKNKIYVWRKSDERLRSECLGVRIYRETQCRASVMFRGCISYYGVGT